MKLLSPRKKGAPASLPSTAEPPTAAEPPVFDGSADSEPTLTPRAPPPEVAPPPSSTEPSPIKVKPTADAPTTAEGEESEKAILRTESLVSKKKAPGLKLFTRKKGKEEEPAAPPTAAELPVFDGSADSEPTLTPRESAEPSPVKLEAKLTDKELAEQAMARAAEKKAARLAAEAAEKEAARLAAEKQAAAEAKAAAEAENAEAKAAAEAEKAAKKKEKKEKPKKEAASPVKAKEEAAEAEAPQAAPAPTAEVVEVKQLTLEEKLLKMEGAAAVEAEAPEGDVPIEEPKKAKKSGIKLFSPRSPPKKKGKDEEPAAPPVAAEPEPPAAAEPEPELPIFDGSAESEPTLTPREYDEPVRSSRRVSAAFPSEEESAKLAEQAMALAAEKKAARLAAEAAEARGRGGGGGQAGGGGGEAAAEAEKAAKKKEKKEKHAKKGEEKNQQNKEEASPVRARAVPEGVFVEGSPITEFIGTRVQVMAAITLQDAARNARARLLAKKIAAKKAANGEVRPDPIRRAIDKALASPPSPRRCRRRQPGTMALGSSSDLQSRRPTLARTWAGHRWALSSALALPWASSFSSSRRPCRHSLSRHPRRHLHHRRHRQRRRTRQTSSKRSCTQSLTRAILRRLLRHPRPSHHRPRLPSNRLRFLRSA